MEIEQGNQDRPFATYVSLVLFSSLSHLVFHATRVHLLLYIPARRLSVLVMFFCVSSGQTRKVSVGGV